MMKLRVKIQNRTYEVEVGDLLARPIQATIDGQVFEVWPEEQPLHKRSNPHVMILRLHCRLRWKPYPLRSAALAVVAPIPGVIVSIEVKPGDSIERADPLHPRSDEDEKCHSRHPHRQNWHCSYRCGRDSTPQPGFDRFH
jgi:biotin carboxyl carrier protein